MLSFYTIFRKNQALWGIIHIFLTTLLSPDPSCVLKMTIFDVLSEYVLAYNAKKEDMKMMKWLLTGGMVPLFLLIGGLFFAVYLKGMPLKNPMRMGRALMKKEASGRVTPMRALLLALAGTLGVGNIVGVANAIAIGGAGAIFWMWATSILAMVLKYAEVVLAVLHRKKDSCGYYGGAVYYIQDALEKKRHFRSARIIPAVFAILTVVDALAMGCVIQTDAVRSSFSGVLEIPTWVTALIMLGITMPIVVKGVSGIAALTDVLVPVMTFGYLGMSIAVVVLRWNDIPQVFSSVFSEAFSGKSVAGGAVGFLTSQALRVGTMRGILSNEAGCGTAPIAHASAEVRDAAKQGVLGIVEVLVDTLVLCTATAVVILLCPDVISDFSGDPLMMAVEAYHAQLGGFAKPFFVFAVFCFGYATLLCWGNYGLQSVRFLTGKKVGKIFYFCLFGCAILIGAFGAPEWIWEISDFAIAALTAINLPILIMMRREVREETERYFG